MWTLSPQRKTIRMKFLGGCPSPAYPGPCTSTSIFDAGTVDAIVSRLTRLRLQMLPPPPEY